MWDDNPRWTEGTDETQTGKPLLLIFLNGY